MSAMQRQQLTPFIKYAHFFRVTLQSPLLNNTILDSSHPLVTAFKRGVLHPLFKSQLNLQQVRYMIPIIDSLDSLFTADIYGLCSSNRPHRIPLSGPPDH